MESELLSSWVRGCYTLAKFENYCLTMSLIYLGLPLQLKETSVPFETVVAL